jgi:glucokinase
MAQVSGGVALLGHVGRKRVRFALTDELGRLRPETIHSHDATEITSISGAIMAFLQTARLDDPPRRSAFAVAGLTRGDTISVTRSRCFLSRSGLNAMLGHEAVILNDFEAEAWAMHGLNPRPQEFFDRRDSFSLHRAGRYCVIGMTSGLGVSILSRSGSGAVQVLATEAGHGGFVPGTEEIARLVADMFPGRYPVAAEDVLSAPGLLAIYTTLSRRSGVAPQATTPEEITRRIGSDKLAALACTVLCRAFWAHAGNLTTTFGAWDGVIVTGGLGAALRAVLRQPEMQQLFAGRGKYTRLLDATPRVFMSVDHGELIGAAEMVRHRGESTIDPGPAREELVRSEF